MPPYAHAKVLLWMTERVAVEGATILETTAPACNQLASEAAARGTAPRLHP